MNEFFKTILSLSLSGSFLIAVLLLSGPVYRKRIGRQWQYYIWLLVIARLLLPVTPKVSLVGTLFRQAEQKAKQETLYTAVWGNTVLREDGASWPASRQEALTNPERESGAGGKAAVTGEGSAEDSKTAAAGEAGTAGSKTVVTGEGGKRTAVLRSLYRELLTNLWVVWLMGALLLLLRRVTVYQSFVKYVRAGGKEIAKLGLLEELSRIKAQYGIGQSVELYENPLVSTPMLIGFFKPCIVLPTSEMPEEAFAYTIRHELIHCKRLDLFYKWLMQVTLCLHWFNPLVWLMEKRLGRACELSCDEALIVTLDEEGRRAYGNTLLYAAEAGCGRHNPASAVTLCESAKLLKERLGAIMNFRKMTKGGVCVLLLLIAVLCCGFTFAGAYAQNAAAFGGEDVVTMETLEVFGHTYYLVFDEAQLRAIGRGKYGMDKNYLQQADILLSEEEWIPIGTADNPFTGSYNGNGFEIAGLTMIDPEAEIVGLFGVARDAKICNVILRNAAPAGGEEREQTAPVLAVGLGSTACFDNIILESGMPDSDMERYFENGSLAQFSQGFWTLQEEKQKKWLERIYEEGEIAFFDACTGWLDADSPLIRYFAEKAYEDSEVGFFSVLVDDMEEEALEEWIVRAVRDKRNNFAAVLYTAAGREDELDRMEKKLDAESDREYQAYGITHNGRNWYYQGELVHIILETGTGKSFYRLDMNPQGTADIHVFRDENWDIQSVAQMSAEERKSLFGQ